MYSYKIRGNDFRQNLALVSIQIAVLGITGAGSANILVVNKLGSSRFKLGSRNYKSLWKQWWI